MSFVYYLIVLLPQWLIVRTMNTAFAVSESRSLLIMFAPRSNRSRSRIKLVVFQVDKTLSILLLQTLREVIHLHLNLYWDIFNIIYWPHNRGYQQVYISCPLEIAIPVKSRSWSTCWQGTEQLVVMGGLVREKKKRTRGFPKFRLSCSEGMSMSLSQAKQQTISYHSSQVFS